jgi:hypothetical protein
MIATALAMMAMTPATTVGMSAREYRYGVYRPVVRRGTVTLVLHNFGEDDHDVQVRGPHGYRSAVSPDVDPGETIRFTVHLRRRGRYLLICTKPGHAKKGMTARLKVR